MQNNLPSYIEWYGDPANDTYEGNYLALFNVFDGASDDPPPAALLTTVASGEDSNLAFAILDNDARVHVVHRLKRFQARATVIHPQNGNVLATLGNVFPGGFNTVVFPGTYFHRTVELDNVLTAAAIEASLLAHPAAIQVVAVAPPDPPADFAPARTRAAMLIPPHLAGRILEASVAPGGLSPATLWTQFTSPLLDDPLAAPMCTPFIDWCRIAYSHGIGPLNTAAVDTPGNILLDNTIFASRQGVLQRDLPGRFLVPAPNVDPIAAAVEVLGGIRADAAQRDEVAVLRAAQTQAAAHLPSKRWGDSVNRLMRLCHVDDENFLPELWRSMAKTHTKVDITTIQTYLDKEMPELGSSGRRHAAAICSSDLAKQLGSLSFQTDDNDTIDVGLSIFSICYPTQASAFAASEAAGCYSSMLQGTTGLSLDDTIKLSASQKFFLPTNMLQLKRVCWAYHRLLAVVLGVEHVITQAFGEFVESFMAREDTLDSVFSNVMACTSLLRFVQLRMHKWAKEQMHGVTLNLPAPSFKIVFDELDEQRWVAPTLPLKYLQPHPSHAPALLPGPAPPSAQAPTGQQLAGAFNVKAEFLDIERVPIRKHFATKRHIDKHGPTPRNNQGQAMCLLFHVRASCKHDCPRAQDHRKHSLDESQRLAAYLALDVPSPTPALPAN